MAPGALAQDEALRAAARLDAEGKCEEAEPFYQQALAAGPPSPALLNNLGNHYVVCGQPEKAREYFERLLAAIPAHTNARLQLARIAADRKDGAKALEYLAGVRESGPAVLLLRAEASHWAGQTDAALTILDDLGKKAASDPRVLFTLALTAARIGLYQRAENAFSAVLTHFPDNFEVMVNLGRAAARAGHYGRAQGVLEAALRVKPGDVDALFELGLVHAANQDPSRAVFVLTQARKQAPRRSDILLALARAADDAEYYGDAALAFDEYLELQPDDDTARRDRGRVCAHTETRREEGLKELEWYLAKHPDDPQAHYELALLRWEDEPDEALKHLAAALRLDPDFASAHLSIGWLLHRLGRTEEAVPHLQTAIRLQPKSLRALDQLGLAYLTLDKLTEAEETLQQALTIAPEDPEVLLHMGRTLMALEREEEAQEFLERFRTVRPPQGRDHGTEARMIELASLSPAERRSREIERFRQWSESRPDEAEFQMHLANLLLADGQTEEAVAEFRALLEKNSNSEIQLTAGKSLLRIEQYDLARRFLELAVAERPAARLDLAVALLFTEGPEVALEALDKTPADERNGDYLLMTARILDAAGRAEDADRVLREGLRHSARQPEIARQAAILLVRHDHTGEALDWLEKAIAATPGSADLLLTKAIVLSLANRSVDAEETLQQIESRWPEWDRTYLAHGLLLEQSERPAEARQKIQTAIALGTDDLAARCALARLDGTDVPDPRCKCVKGIRELLLPGCTER
jgi:tetratricopeptide (TPR) repeat protein